MPTTYKLMLAIIKEFLPLNMKTESVSEDLANELVEAKILVITQEVSFSDKQSALKKANAKGAAKEK